MILRITTTLILITMVFFAPWWVTLALTIAATFIIDSYYEILPLGALADILYGTLGDSFMGHGAIGFIISVAVFLSVEKIKKELR